jgi:hypothetical protein
MFIGIVFFLLPVLLLQRTEGGVTENLGRGGFPLTSIPARRDSSANVRFPPAAGSVKDSVLSFFMLPCYNKPNPPLQET